MRVPRPILLTVAALGLIAIVGIGFAAWHWKRHVPASPELATPIMALAHLPQLHGSALYFTPAALEFVKPHWAEWAMRAPSIDGTQQIHSPPPEELANQFGACAQNPKAWHALDREWRFNAALLTGDPAGFRAVLDALHKSPDWTLTWLDHTSLIFQRGSTRPWAATDLDSLKAAFATHSSAERVEIRVQTAHRLTALGEIVTAQALLDEAIKIDPNSAPAWTELACTHAMLTQWDRALEASNRAIDSDKRYLPAIASKANALYALGKFNDALVLTRRLVLDTPDDGQILALHARVTHAAHAFQEEIEVLTRIIALSQSKTLPTGAWHIFLAQAYAEDGQGEPALQQFEAALKQPELTDQQRAFAQKGIDRLQSRQPIF